MLPADTGAHDGLAYTLWLPTDSGLARGGVVVVHGAGSCKESHHDYARAAVALGLGAICFDQRGHGESGGQLDARAIDDVASIAGRLREALGDDQAPVALRGSSMGGYLAILAARPARAGAVVAICPASARGLARGLAAGKFGFEADAPTLGRLLEANELGPAVSSLSAPLLLLHAQGDEQVPVEHSRELARAIGAAGGRLVEVPGGHHRSIQHDEELQALSLRFIVRELGVSGR